MNVTCKIRLRYSRERAPQSLKEMGYRPLNPEASICRISTAQVRAALANNMMPTCNAWHLYSVFEPSLSGWVWGGPSVGCWNPATPASLPAMFVAGSASYQGAVAKSSAFCPPPAPVTGTTVTSVTNKLHPRVPFWLFFKKQWLCSFPLES